MNTVIIYGPPRSGKTFNSEQLRHDYGCSSVVDGWQQGDPITPGALHLTNAPPRVDNPRVRVVKIKAALTRSGIRWPVGVKS
jgi:hypothetical protein